MVPEDFTETTIAVGSNSVKSTLFRISAIILKIVVYKFFSFIASRCSSFTSHLMFAEDHIQRLLFTVAPGRAFTRQSVVVFGFSILIILGSLYDQVLWAVDKPGYTQTLSIGLASKFRDKLLAPLKSTETAVFLYNDYRGPDTIDWEQELSAGLFKTGLNASLTSKILLLDRKVTPDQISTNPYQPGEPRIHLDDNGLSLHLDPPRVTGFGLPNYNDTVALASENIDVKSAVQCYDRKNDTLWAWNCPIAKVKTNEYMTTTSHSRPYIAFRGPEMYKVGDGGIPLGASSLSPWQYLAGDTSTAINKEIITFYHGTTRHVFLASYEKVVLIGNSDEKLLQESDVVDLLSRTGVHGSANLEDTVKTILEGQAEGRSFTIGEQSKDGPFEISSRYYDYLNLNYRTQYNSSQVTGPYAKLPGSAGELVINANSTLSILRCVTIKLTLMMQEDLGPIDSGITGIPESCSHKENKYGGKMRYYTKTQPSRVAGKVLCHEMADTDANFLNNKLVTTLPDLPTYLGHIDQPSSMVLLGILENLNETTYSRRLYSPSATTWLQQNQERVNNLLLARAMLSAMNRSDLTYITLTNLSPAISYLQILLVCIPIVSLIAIYLLFLFFDGGHYNSSLLMSLLTTTHLTKGLKGRLVDHCNDPPYYLWNMEDVVLKKSKDGHVYLGAVQDGKAKRFELVSDDEDEGGEEMEGLMDRNGETVAKTPDTLTEIEEKEN